VYHYFHPHGKHNIFPKIKLKFCNVLCLFTYYCRQNRTKRLSYQWIASLMKPFLYSYIASNKLGKHLILHMESACKSFVNGFHWRIYCIFFVNAPAGNSSLELRYFTSSQTFMQCCVWNCLRHKVFVKKLSRKAENCINAVSGFEMHYGICQGYL